MSPYPERNDAYKDLGGSVSNLDSATERALYSQGLGSREMRLRVAEQLRQEQDAAQHLVNKTGAEAVRNAAIDADRNKGINTDSVEYRLKLIKEERSRTRRA
jgi:hypothetical protein